MGTSGIRSVVGPQQITAPKETHLRQPGASEVLPPAGSQHNDLGDALRWSGQRIAEDLLNRRPNSPTSVVRLGTARGDQVTIPTPVVTSSVPASARLGLLAVRQAAVMQHVHHGVCGGDGCRDGT